MTQGLGGRKLGLCIQILLKSLSGRGKLGLSNAWRDPKDGKFPEVAVHDHALHLRSFPGIAILAPAKSLACG